MIHNRDSTLSLIYQESKKVLANNRSRYNKLLEQYSKQSGEIGAAATLAAIILPMLLLVLGLVFYSTMAPSNITQLHAFTNHMALAAIKAYSFSECTSPDDIPNCHLEKKEIALSSLRAFIDRNKNKFGNIEIGEASSSSGFFFQPLRYLHESRSSGNSGRDSECPSYPCLKRLRNNDLATAIRISGEIPVLESPILTFANRLLGAEHGLTTTVSATGITNPLDIVLAVDTSGSLVEETHLSPGFINSIDDESGAPTGSDDPISSFVRTSDDSAQENFRFDGDFSGENNGEVDLQASFFTIEVDDRPEPIHQEVRELFNELPQKRGSDTPIDARVHTQDDYSFQFPTHPLSQGGWSSYAAKQFHPEPIEATSENGLSHQIYVPPAGTDDNSRLYFTDSYRSGTHRGPEPLRSVLEAAGAIITRLKQRQNTQDYISLIFFSHYLAWPQVINMTNDLSYIDAILNDSSTGVIDAAGTMKGLDPRSTLPSPRDYDEPSDPHIPLFYQLGLFPKDIGFTHTHRAYEEALYQFKSVPGNRNSSKAVIHVGDGLVNCVGGELGADTTTFPNCTQEPPENANCAYRPLLTGPSVACRSSYDIYQAADESIDRFVGEHFFKNRITLNIAQFGKIGGAHHLRLGRGPSDDTCIDAEEAKKNGQNFVRGEDFFSIEHGRGVYNNRYVNPFFEAAADMSRRAEMTGGKYKDILEQASDCSDVPTTCPDFKDSEAERVTLSCDSKVDQLINAFKDIIIHASKFSLLDRELSIEN